ncbi:MAG: ComEC/Rec2 family competence protein [Terricaulis sp.]
MTTLMGAGAVSSKRARGSTRLGFSEILAQQSDRWILWLAPALIAGAAAWLSWPREPPAWLGATAFAGAGVTAWLLAAWPSASVDAWPYVVKRVVSGVVALFAAAGLGAGAAQLRTATVAQVSFAGGDAPVVVEGWVMANDPSENGPRLRLLVRRIEGVTSPPVYARVSVADAGVLAPGRAARCRAILGPPSGPLAPGGYDFARRAYFEQLGATGFAYGRCRPVDLPAPDFWLDRWRLLLAAIRADLSAEIVAAAPGRGGALAAALVTGDRAPLDGATNDSLRDSGLGHLVSVSGIHMGVVGGLVFAMLMGSLSLVGPIALRWPVKKIAAVGALLMLALYLVISGGSVPALRAFVMACVAFGAILLDRPAISMRGLALAALVVVLIFPESVLEPGFQMSFAATMALVALFEMMKRAPHEPALPTPGPIIGALNWATRGIGAVLLISFVAGIATDPFAIYHFQRFSLYALPANLIVAPIMSFLVAPAAGAAAVLAPFGLADPALEVMASALDLVVAVGGVFGERPEAVRALLRPPDAAFMLCVIALLWACLWRGWLRWGGAGLFAASIVLYLLAPTPVAAFDSEMRAVFVRGHDGWRLIARGGRSTYARERLGAMLGIAPLTIERLPPPEQCAEAACTLSLDGQTALLVRTEAGLVAALADRSAADSAIIMTHLSIPPEHRERRRLVALIDAANLARLGGGFIYAAPDGLRLTRALDPATRRPWTPRTPALDQE